jgi:hypothetical protein
MKRTQLYLDEEAREILDKISKQTGKSVGQLIREAVGEVYGGKRALEQPFSSSDPIWRFIGKGRSKETDISARHDDYLYGNQDENLRLYQRMVRSE